MKHFQSKLLMLAFCIFLAPSLFALSETLNAKISLDLTAPNKGKITPYFFSSFLEFIKGYMVGPFGMTAQELLDRGFDRPNTNTPGVALNWNTVSANSGQGFCSLESGGYNKRGVYSQRITKTNSVGAYGLYQHVFLTDSIANAFYVYAKSLSRCTLSVSLTDSSFANVYFSKELAVDSSDWQKISFDIPYLPNITNAMFIIAVKGDTGTVEIDEISLMAKNNVCGIRNEHYQLFKNLKPGLLRYPGGCFADIPISTNLTESDSFAYASFFFYLLSQ